jgi:hypothetical protein
MPFIFPVMTQKDTDEYFVSDAAFDTLYPVYIQQLSALHWTPLDVARKAAAYLAPDADARVIDVGAGAGKFCIAGGHYTRGSFTGIEQRKNFVTIGNKAIKQLKLDKVSLLYGNFTELDMRAYTGVYFFNSFHENIVHDDALDKKIELSGELYNSYTAHLHAQLTAMAPGTRLATYWLSITEIPGSYRLCETHFNNLLKLWVKMD